jgi:hypothetical protein
MPRFKQKKTGDVDNEWYIHAPGSGNPPVYTFQVTDDGRNLLLDAGLTDESFLDWEVFWMLESLGYLYTFGDDYDPSDARPEDITFESLDLTDDQRLALAQRLIERHSLSALFEYESIVQFFVDLTDLDNDHLRTLLDTVLASTPWSYVFPMDFPYYDIVDGHPLVIGLVLGVIDEHLRTDDYQAKFGADDDSYELTEAGDGYVLFRDDIDYESVLNDDKHGSDSPWTTLCVEIFYDGPRPLFERLTGEPEQSRFIKSDDDEDFAELESWQRAMYNGIHVFVYAALWVLTSDRTPIGDGLSRAARVGLESKGWVCLAVPPQSD